ncbi:MAG: hypothetical protein GY811_06545 [Myxococcales bacterium]|nr:hypothetical protein [Myxococcales bacterium]
MVLRTGAPWRDLPGAVWPVVDGVGLLRQMDQGRDV